MMATKELAHQSPHSITRRRVTNLAAGGDTDARRPLCFPSHQNDKMGRDAPAGFALHCQKFGPLTESMAARQALRD
jgi:hypothetical protein